MAGEINQTITGVFDHNGEAITYGDTDSCYFSAYRVWKDDPAFANFDWTPENIIQLCDEIADAANATFPDFMNRTFNTGLVRGAIIAAGRELVASKCLFIKKKKYACLMIDKEGKRLDVDGKAGKLKAMGLDLKRADTPKFMQKFLECLLMGLLTGAEKSTQYEDIREFREAFKERPSWEKGSPKKVSNMTGPMEAMAAVERLGLTGRAKAGQKLLVTMPGHTRASINWNRLCDMYDDRHAMRISDGTRIIVCKLKSNVMGMDSVAYPIDEPHLPAWFCELPFDDDLMEQTVVDMKLLNLVGVLDWDLTDTKPSMGEEYFTFGDDPVAAKPDSFGHNGGPDWDEDDDD